MQTTAKRKRPTLIKLLASPRYRQLLTLITAHRLRFGLAMLCMIVMAAASAASAYLIKPVLDDIFINRDVHMLRVIPASGGPDLPVARLGHVRPGILDELRG